jgi:hypothetical protein
LRSGYGDVNAGSLELCRQRADVISIERGRNDRGVLDGNGRGQSVGQQMGTVEEQ